MVGIITIQINVIFFLNFCYLIFLGITKIHINFITFSNWTIKKNSLSCTWTIKKNEK